MNGSTSHVCEAQPLEPELSVFGFCREINSPAGELATLSGILMLASVVWQNTRLPAWNARKNAEETEHSGFL